MSNESEAKKYPALVVNQWLQEWDGVKFDESNNQARPPGHFYLLSLPAATLRGLSGIYRREVVPDESRVLDMSIQRRHDEKRSKEIGKYVREGFPYSTLKPGPRRVIEKDGANLLKPGWLPSAIIVNILRPGDTRRDGTLRDGDAIHIPESVANGVDRVDYSLPSSWTGPDWRPESIRPIEVIDGQHRLWAFDQTGDQDLNFNLPVVAFCGLDISWQAYLFWIINIKPKRINSSLAFDLYPLLRDQDWLMAGEGLMVYRQTRAQELSEALWGTPESPWFQRINMLGETGVRVEQPVTQAAFVNALVVTFVRSWDSGGGKTGGFFGGSSRSDRDLRWSRVQQAGYLCLLWKILNESIRDTHASWAVELRGLAKASSSRKSKREDLEVDFAFASPFCLLSSDQGVRAVLTIFNDFSYVTADSYHMQDWQIDEETEEFVPQAISSVIAKASSLPIAELFRELCDAMATYDWRNSKSESLSVSERTNKLAFRGSGGYKELRRQVVEHLISTASPRIQEISRVVKSLSS